MQNAEAKPTNPFFVSQYSSAFNEHLRDFDGEVFHDKYLSQDLKMEAYKPAHSFNPNVAGSNSLEHAQQLESVGRVPPAYCTEKLKTDEEYNTDSVDVSEILNQPLIDSKTYGIREPEEKAKFPWEEYKNNMNETHFRNYVTMKTTTNAPFAKNGMSQRQNMRRHIPGYYGYVHGEPFIFGKTFGDATEMALANKYDPPAPPPPAPPTKYYDAPPDEDAMPLYDQSVDHSALLNSGYAMY